LVGGGGGLPDPGASDNGGARGGGVDTHRRDTVGRAVAVVRMPILGIEPV